MAGPTEPYFMHIDQEVSPWKLCVAPMMDWTDRHCRFFHRQLTRHARLYTEMVTTGALLHGNRPRHLDFNGEEHPVALQLGGSEPEDLAACAALGEQWGYDEINLNCGCPSERVQRGAFGACLMAEPRLVTDCVKAMCDAVSVPVTVKHRIGIDRIESYAFMRDFVGTVAEAGCRVFIVHARNAWLKGISPKENRELPPLRYELVYRLKREFPDLTIVLNGGIRTGDEIETHLAHVDGVMVGREAYHRPWTMSGWDARFFFGAANANAALEAGADTDMEPNVNVNPNAVVNMAITRAAVEAAMVRYMEQVVGQGEPWSHVARHLLGLRNGMPGARLWRQVWSDHALKDRAPAFVAARADAAAAAAPSCRRERPDAIRVAGGAGL